MAESTLHPREAICQLYTQEDCIVANNVDKELQATCKYDTAQVRISGPLSMMQSESSIGLTV